MWRLARHGSLRSPENQGPGLATTTGVVLIAVVMAGLGTAAYGLMGGFSSVPPTTCVPITSPACASYENLHDISVFAPFKSASQGASVSFTSSVPPGESAGSFTYNFGDGSPSVTTSNTVANHTYTEIGEYLISVTAQINGVTHDNLHSLVLLHVTPSASTRAAGSLPSVSGSIVSNSTAPTGSSGITAVLTAGQSITVQGSYTAQPTNPLFSAINPTISATGGTVSGNPSAGPNSTQATVSYPTPGIYDLKFVGGATNSTTTIYQNYTWTVYVATPGKPAGVTGIAAPTSPHPGEIIAYELAPGGAFSEDPAIDYETVGAEPIFGVYQTLITYNGTSVGPSPTDFIPEAATCVPGSAQCIRLYNGDSLINGTNYTFVIQPNERFYDPQSGANWSMYPTDVEFSVARDLGFSTLPFPTERPGWILAQSLLNPGNDSWSLIHGAYNNTPERILGAMSVNNSKYCPAAALKPGQGNGCITFNAYGANHAWPDFLELVADPLGSGIVSCGWFSAHSQNAGIPYWTQNNISGAGDHPCGSPGTVQQNGKVLGLPCTGPGACSMPATGWDQWEELGSGSFNGQFLGNVQWSMLGSGPYYLAAYVITSSYELKANPAWQQNPYCTWSTCQPSHGQYVNTVEVTWEDQETEGEQAYKFGSADFASIPTTSIGLLLQLIQAGKVNAIQVPTLNVFFQAFDMQFNLAGAQQLDTNPITVPDDFFTYLGMREFWSRAYPYATIQNTILTKDGIQFEFNEGGAIPQFMGNYYPSNIPWPNTDPCTSTTSPTCPAYWWAQMQDPSSAYYDPEATHCTSSAPCQLPLIGTTGNPTGDEINALWISELSSLSGGALKVTPVDINFNELVGDSEAAVAGQSPLPIYGLGWAPDYPDPTDYVTPMYAANSTYTAGNAVAPQLEQPQFDDNCAQPASNYAYWAAQPTIPQKCQGVAYHAMLKEMGVASSQTNLTLRVQEYDQIEQIAYNLCLYTWTGQANAIPNFASWVNINSVDTNVMDEGTWWTLTGNSVQYAGST